MSFAYFSPGKWTLSSERWTQHRRRWLRTSTICVANCGQSLLHQRLILLVPMRRRTRPGIERITSSMPNVTTPFCSAAVDLALSNPSEVVFGFVCFFVFAIDSNVLFLKKTDMESVFNLFQDREENKTLVYVSIQTSFFSTPHFFCIKFSLFTVCCT